MKKTAFNVPSDAQTGMHCGGLLRLWQRIFSARKDLEISFHSYGGHVNLVHCAVRARNGVEKNFHNYGDPAKLNHA